MNVLVDFGWARVNYVAMKVVIQARKLGTGINLRSAHGPSMGHNLLHSVVWDNQQDLVTLILVDKNFDHFEEEWDGENVFHTAVQDASTEVLRLLLDYGKGSWGHMLQETVHGKTPLQLAEDNGNEEMQKLLKEHELYAKLSETQDPTECKKIVDELNPDAAKWQCKVCWDRDCTLVLGCGHLLCQECRDEVHECPTCRQPINRREVRRMFV